MRSPDQFAFLLLIWETHWHGLVITLRKKMIDTKIVPAKIALQLIKTWEGRYENVIDLSIVALKHIQHGEVGLAQDVLQKIVDEDIELKNQQTLNLAEALKNYGE